MTRSGWLSDGRARPRVIGVAHQVRGRAVLQRRPAQPPAGDPARRAQRLGRGHPDPLERVDLVGDAAVGDHAARVGARVDRHPRLARGRDARMARLVQVAHVLRVASGTSPPPSAMPGKFSMLISVGTSAVPCSTISSMVSSVSPVPCSMQSMPALISPGSASSPNTCAVTRAPLACAASIAASSTSSDHSGARSPTSRSIQSPTSLTQPSPQPRLFGHRVRQLRLVLQFDRRGRAGTAWAGPGAGRRG